MLIYSVNEQLLIGTQAIVINTEQRNILKHCFFSSWPQFRFYLSLSFDLDEFVLLPLHDFDSHGTFLFSKSIGPFLGPQLQTTSTPRPAISTLFSPASHTHSLALLRLKLQLLFQPPIHDLFFFFTLFFFPHLSALPFCDLLSTTY